MRLILSIALLLFTVAVRADDIHWFNGNLAQAQAAAAQQQRNLFVVFHATWCGPCHQLLEKTLPDPALTQLINDRTVPVLIDVDQNKALAKQFSILFIPTIIVLRASGDEVDRPGADTDPKVLLQSITYALDHGRTLGELQAALAADPTNPDLKYALLIKHAVRVEVDKALEYKARLEKDHPEFYAKVRESLLQTVAQACEIGGRLPLAIGFYRELLTFSIARDARQFAYSRTTSLLLRSGKAAEGMDTWEAAMREFPGEVYWYEGYLQIAHNEKLRLDRAVDIGALAKKLSLPNKRAGSLRYWLAVVYKDLGRLAEARTEIDDAIKLDPRPEYQQFRDALGS